jgi:hypothetical protein
MVRRKSERLTATAALPLLLTMKAIIIIIDRELALSWPLWEACWQLYCCRSSTARMLTMSFLVGRLRTDTDGLQDSNRLLNDADPGMGGGRNGSM